MKNNWKTKAQSFIYRVIDIPIAMLTKLGVSPNMVTLFGFLLTLVATIIFVYGAENGSRTDHKYIAYASCVILLAGLMDMVDGRMARISGKTSEYGAMFDSVMDRYSELFMFLGICYYLVSFDYFLSSLFAFIAMIGSIMVSYTRARAEGLGVSPSIGFMQRPERILIISLSGIATGLFSYFVGPQIKIQPDISPLPIFETTTIFTFPIAIMAIFANVTALRRLFYTKKTLNSRS